MSTFIKMAAERGGMWGSTNNAVKGAATHRSGSCSMNHRGLTMMRRAKAAFWCRYLHSEFKASEAEMLKAMKTDEEIEELFALTSKSQRRDDGIPDKFSSGAPEWGGLHMSKPKELGWL